MTLVSPTQVSPNDEVAASSINTPVNQIAAVVNGNIDDTNIASVSGSKLTNATVTTAKINNAAVTADKLSTGATKATVATSETTGSATATDLTTSGPSVTVTIGANRLALVVVRVQFSDTTANAAGLLYVTVSGASTITAYQVGNNRSATAGQAIYITGSTVLNASDGLNAGSNTFKLQYSTTNATATFSNREISVIPL